MKKFVLIALLIVALGGLTLFAATPGGFGLGTWSFVLDPNKTELRKLARDFLESIQYKDFKTAANFHSPEDSKKADIPKLIEQLFKIKPEFLNIRDIDVTGVTIDSSGRRARTFFNTNVEVLNSLQRAKDKQRKHRDSEGVLYWHKENGRWWLKLESSLRGPGGVPR